MLERHLSASVKQFFKTLKFYFLTGRLGHESSPNGFKVDQSLQQQNDSRPEIDPHLNGNGNDKQNDRFHNEEDDTCKERKSTSPRQFSPPQASLNMSPTFFNFPFSANDEGRHIKDQALNLALEFNGRGSGSRPPISLLGTPKMEENDESLPGNPANEEPVSGEGGNPASMAASVQSALAALQAGQISLNQVI